MKGTLLSGLMLASVLYLVSAHVIPAPGGAHGIAPENQARATPTFPSALRARAPATTPAPPPEPAPLLVANITTTLSNGTVAIIPAHEIACDDPSLFCIPKELSGNFQVDLDAPKANEKAVKAASPQKPNKAVVAEKKPDVRPVHVHQKIQNKVQKATS